MRSIFCRKNLLGIGLFVLLFCLVPLAKSDLRPEKVFLADIKKSKSYVQDGLVTGGHSSIDQVVIKDIRRAPNPGFDRIVIDLQGSHGDPAVQGAPFYQVAVTPEE